MRAFLAALVIIALLIPQASAIQTPEVTLYPSMLSANASFVAVADPGNTASIRASWTVPGVANAYGLFPRVGDLFICYFSSSDSKANCGPTPFIFSTFGFPPYTMMVDAVDQYGGIANYTKDVSVGGITLIPTTQIIDNTLYMVILASSASASRPDPLKYSVYRTDMTPVLVNREFAFRITDNSFIANISLNPGEYYVAYWGTDDSTGDFGGSLLRVMIGMPGALPPGVTGVLDIEEVSLNILINPNQHYEKSGLRITNLGSTTVSNLSVRVPETIEGFVTVTLGTNTLFANDTAFYTVMLDNVDSSLDINTQADVLSNDNVVGQIPLKITASVMGAAPGAPSVGAAPFTITPTAWIGDYLITGNISRSFTITNNGDSALTGLSYTTTGDLAAIVGVNLPLSLEAGETGTMEVIVSPFSPGTYIGTITVESASGSQAVLAGLSIYPDMSGSITDAKTSLDDLRAALTPDQQAQLSSVLSGITEDLDSSQLDFGIGSYESAQRYLASGQAKLNVLQAVASAGAIPSVPTTPGPSAPPLEIDPTAIIILIVIVGAAVGGWFFLKKVRKPKKMEEELEEEF